MAEKTERRSGCLQCRDHRVVKNDLEGHKENLNKLWEASDGKVPMGTFKWIIGGIGILSIVILGFIVNLTGSFGELSTELRTSSATEKVKVEMMEKQVDQIAAIQKDLSLFVANHRIRRHGPGE